MALLTAADPSFAAAVCVVKTMGSARVSAGLLVHAGACTPPRHMDVLRWAQGRMALPGAQEHAMGPSCATLDCLSLSVPQSPQLHGGVLVLLWCVGAG